MGIVSSSKTISKDKIGCGERFNVTLGISATPDIKTAPKDICLILDRSGSMTGEPIANLKKAALDFVGLIDKASNGGVAKGTIGNGSRISVVSFSTVAVIDVPLSTDVAALNAAINRLNASGSTNHEEAFKKGVEALKATTTNEKVMVMFTDGQSNAGQEGFQITDAAKQDGIIIYTIGYGDTKKLDIQAINRWASAPSQAYTLITPNFIDITAAFLNLVDNISSNGSTNILLKDVVADCLKIVAVEDVTKGSANIVDEHTIEWRIPALGVNGTEGGILTFTVEQTGNCQGNVKVNRRASFSDNEGSTIFLNDPMVNINCTSNVIFEECPVSYDITMAGCTDAAEFDAGEIAISSLGRILQLSVTLKNVCPNKRVALGVLVYEVDANGNEFPRGMKTVLIPAQQGSTCKDVSVRCIKFVLPEELDMTGDPNAMCNSRHFKGKFVANYVDNDYECCK